MKLTRPQHLSFATVRTLTLAVCASLMVVACSGQLDSAGDTISTGNSGNGSITGNGTASSSSGGGITTPTPTYTVGGTVTGLSASATGLVIQNGVGRALPIAGDGRFVFSNALAPGDAYSVSVQTQPATPAQFCRVTGGTGVISDANVTSVAIDCLTTGKYLFTTNTFDNNGDGSIAAFTINPNTGALTAAAGSPYTPTEMQPYSVAVDPTGQYIYVANAGSASISTDSVRASGALTLDVSTASTGNATNQPSSIAIDPTGPYLYVGLRVPQPAPTFIQAASGDGGSSSVSTVAATFSAAQTAGDLIVVAVGWGSSMATATVTDSAGNSYSVASPALVATGASFTQEMFYAPNIKSAGAGANTVTVTFSTAVPYTDVRVAEYSNVIETSPIDVVAPGGEATNGPALSSGNATTTNANDLLVAASYCNTTVIGVGGGYTQRVLSDGNNIQDEVVSTTGTYNATATQVGSGFWITQMVAFKGLSGGSNNDNPNGTLEAYALNGGVLTPVGGTLAASVYPAGNIPYSLAIDSGNALLFGAANAYDGDLFEYSIGAGGALTAIAGSPFPFQQGLPINNPYAVALYPGARFLYVTDATANTVSLYSYDTHGALTLSAVYSDGSTIGVAPHGVTVDPTGSFLYVANSGSGTVSAFTINPANGVLTPVAGSPFTASGTASNSVATFVQVDPSAHFAYVSNGDAGTISVFAINFATGALTAVGNPVPSVISSGGPSSIAIE